MRACDDCKYYFGETCEHPNIGDDFELGGYGDTFEWFYETPDWCPLEGADEVEWVYNKREKLWYPYLHGELLFKTENSKEKPNSCDTCRKKGFEGCEQPCLGCGCCGLYEPKNDTTD